MGKVLSANLWPPQAQVSVFHPGTYILHKYWKTHNKRVEGPDKWILKFYFAPRQNRKGHSFDSSHLAIQCANICDGGFAEKLKHTELHGLQCIPRPIANLLYLPFSAK